MRNWEQAWLAYQPNEDYRDKNIFRSYYTKEYGNCCKRAEEEISIASKALFGTESEKVSEKEEAGIVLEKNPGLSTGEEGYFIQYQILSSDSKRRRKRNFIRDFPPSFHGFCR